MHLSVCLCLCVCVCINTQYSLKMTSVTFWVPHNWLPNKTHKVWRGALTLPCMGPVLPQGTPWDNNAREKETLLDSGGIYTPGEGITQTVGKCRPLTVGGTCCHTKRTPKRTFAIYPGMKKQASNTAWRGQWGDTTFNWSANILTVLPGNQGGGRAGRWESTDLWVRGASQGFQLSGFLSVS